MPASAGRVCSVQTGAHQPGGEAPVSEWPHVGQAERGRLRSEGVPMPPWRGPDGQSPSPTLERPGLPLPPLPQAARAGPHTEGRHRRGVLLHTAPRQPLLTRRRQRQPNMPLDPAQRLWVSPPGGEDPQQESPVRPSTPSGHQLGPQTPVMRTPSTGQGAHREEVPGGVTRCGLWCADRRHPDLHLVTRPR